MKVKFICDCCDLIFKEAEVPSGMWLEDLVTLTGAESHDIILQDCAGSHIGADAYIFSTCGDCKEALGLSDKEDFVVYKEPLLH